jgi:hypothetical protein
MKERSSNVPPKTVIRRAAAALALAVSLVSRLAVAQSTVDDGALAETLFREAKKLMAEHAYAQACPMLAESQRRDPGGGTLLVLADCHEAEGKTATAWAEFNDALAVAQKDGRTDRAAIARARAARLEPRLSRLTVRLSQAAARTQGIEVRRDDLVLMPAAWDVAVPVDPGRHQVTAVAPGKKPRSVDVEVGAEGALAELSIDALEDAPPPAPAEPAAGPALVPPVEARPVQEKADDAGATRAAPQRVAGGVLAGVGGASIVVGAVAGILVLVQHASLATTCMDGHCPSNEQGDVNAYHAKSVVSTVGFIAGAALAGAGTVVLVTAVGPRAPSRTSQVVAYVGLGTLGVRGRF